MRIPKIYWPPGSKEIYHQQERLEIDRVLDLKREHEKTRRWHERHSIKGYRRRIVAHLPGIKIWLVDGAKIQDRLYVDFTMGGHGYRYRFVPLDEIWIDEIYYRARSFWPTVWHEFYERKLMRLGVPYWAAKRGAHVFASKIEILLRRGKHFYLPVGNFAQSRGSFCGPAALRIYLDYLDRKVSERYLAKLCSTTAENGTDPAGIVAAARALGFRVLHRGRALTESEIVNLAPEEKQDEVRRQAAQVSVRRPWTTTVIKRWLHRGYPILANFQVSPGWGEGHYALIVGYTEDGKWILSDPSSEATPRGAGHREMPIEEFDALWYELEDGTAREGFVIKP